MMKRFDYILGLMLCWLIMSCTEQTDIPTARQEQLVTVELDVAVPASMISRAISDDNAIDKEDNFAIYLFKAGKLLDIITPDYQKEGVAAVRWAGSKIYIQHEQTSDPISLLMLANIPADVALPETFTKETTVDQVKTAIEELAYSAADAEKIPMAGEGSLPEGFTLGSKGTVKLVRSLAKVSVNVTNLSVKEFTPTTMIVVNPNDMATVYKQAAGDLAVSDQAKQIGYISENVEDYPFRATFTGENDNYMASIFIPETENTPNGRISVLVGGTNSTSADKTKIYWYRLDLIKEDRTQVKAVMRNYHYQFEIRDMSYLGSQDIEAALALAHADNDILKSEDFGIDFVITDDQIYSITAEYSMMDGVTPYYVGVSHPDILMKSTDEVTYVKLITNYGEDGDGTDEKPGPWQIDAEIVNAENLKTSEYFDFVVPTTKEGTLWIWKKKTLTSGMKFTFYITASSIRKPMTITIE